MAQLLVRKLEDALVATLRQRAAQNGHSMEEEHRLILREALYGIDADKAHMTIEDYLVTDPSESVEMPELPREYPPQELTL